ncbi:uncharacterized protein [Ambystoma mexicanum]|uniref:uncharacterized protein isoform X2 n=1 Tax=Ambystoma mexicanum TaxID=8296 RepID=UPI0037E82CF8
MNTSDVQATFKTVQNKLFPNYKIKEKEKTNSVGLDDDSSDEYFDAPDKQEDDQYYPSVEDLSHLEKEPGPSDPHSIEFVCTPVESKSTSTDNRMVLDSMFGPLPPKSLIKAHLLFPKPQSPHRKGTFCSTQLPLGNKFFSSEQDTEDEKERENEPDKPTEEPKPQEQKTEALPVDTVPDMPDPVPDPVPEPIIPAQAAL